MQIKKLAILGIALCLSCVLAVGAINMNKVEGRENNEVAKSDVAKEISVANEQQKEIIIPTEEQVALLEQHYNSPSTNIINTDVPVVTEPNEEEDSMDEVKKENNIYTKDDVSRLAHLIFAESGSNSMPKEALYYTGSVVLNRVKSKKYPNTIKAVIAQKGQYGVSGYYMKKKPTARCYTIAEDLLKNGSVLPSDYVGQSGYGTYKKYGSKTKYIKVKNMYFYALKK